MSLFFDYFRKTLRWPLIWENGYLSMLAQGAALALDQARQDILTCREQAMPETCDADHLDRIGQSRGVRQWPYEPDDFFRSRVQLAYAFFKMGGKRSGLETIIKQAGLDVDIWEPVDVKAALARFDTPLVDGSWMLNGNVKLSSALGLISLPYLSWAEFAVRINLGTLSDPGQNELLKRLVYEYKPARSLPKFLYWLKMETHVDVRLESQAIAVKTSECFPLSCKNCLDGSWRIGRDTEKVKLDGTWSVDGFFKLGQVLQSAQAKKKITNCRLSGHGGGGSNTTVYAGYPEDTSDIPYFSLSKKPRKLEGSWNLGGFNKVDGSWKLNSMTSLGTPKLGKYPEFKLNQHTKLGYRKPESGSWPQVSGGIYGSGNIN